MGLNSEARAALVFLILYAIDFTILIFMYATRRMRFKSRYTVILFHITVRLASQGSGLAFGIVGFANYRVLVAYFILGAEGYFTLVLCAYRFLISWQYHNTEAGDSWLEPRIPKGISGWERFRRSFVSFGPNRRPMAFLHNLLIIANTLIIAGGSMLAGDTAEQFQKNLPISRAMGTAGQSFFLAMTVFLLYCIIDTVRASNIERKTTGRTFRRTIFGLHPTLLVLLVAWPLLTVRGVYGVMASAYPRFNYFNPANYTETGFATSFVVTSYVLSTTMEWSACTLLMATFFTSRNDPKKRDLPEGSATELKPVGEGASP